MSIMVVISSLMFLSLSLLSLPPTSTSEPTFVDNVCDNATTFAPNSKYHRNLNTVFRSLSSNATAPGSSLFFATSVGSSAPDAVYGLFLCRGDQNATACRDCVSMATSVDLPIYCPNSRVAVIYYDQCMVRYSNHSILRSLDQTSAIDVMNSRNINGNNTKLNLILMNMMNELADLAAGGDKLGKKFAVKQVNFTKLVNLYGLVQCTPDLSSGDCRQCLNSEIPKLFVKKQGAQSLTASCTARYESYPFYIGAVNFSPPTSISTVPMLRNRKKKIPAKVAVAIVVPVVVVSLTVLILCIFCCIAKRSKKHNTTGYGEDFTNVESLQFDLGTLQYVTNDFSVDNKLGEGGFGSVYKGKLPNGQEIAVKRLSRGSGQGIQEIKNEVLVVAKLRHRNLVRLLGFCLVGEEKLLVYEYLSNKSLDYFLFDSKNRAELDWGKRHKIILGIARGMLYLHQDSGVKIIHRDLKASNILLDTDMKPKISDFGMARIFGVDQTQGNTSKVVGTYGYMAPEYAMHGQFSDKSDVYSFGVLVLEIISGKKNSTFYKSGYAEDLLSYTWKQWRKGTYMELVDPIIRESCSSNEVMRCIHLGLLCVQELVDERPSMATLVLMLDSNTITLPVPRKPAFFVQTRPNCDQDVDSDKSMDKPMEYWSVNDVSVVSDFEPR